MSCSSPPRSPGTQRPRYPAGSIPRSGGNRGSRTNATASHGPSAVGPSVPCSLVLVAPMMPGAMRPGALHLIGTKVPWHLVSMVSICSGNPCQPRNHGPHVDRDHGRHRPAQIPWTLSPRDSAPWSLAASTTTPHRGPGVKVPGHPASESPDRFQGAHADKPPPATWHLHLIGHLGPSP